jgi:4-hydroxybenzoate polyprenyltransferase
MSSVARQVPSRQGEPVPLCLQLDGGLIRSDLLSEGIFRLLKQSVLNCLLIPWWRLRGRAELIQQVERRTDWDSTLLPQNEELLAWLRKARQSGRRIVLCSTAGRAVAEQIAARYDLFDAVVASPPEGAELVPAVWGQPPTAWETLRAWLRALRLHQWAKNVLIFVPVAAAHKLLLPIPAFLSTVAFVIFGMSASGTYLLNDLMDLDADRAHPTKRGRPFAAGVLSLKTGLLLAFGLIASGLVLAAGLLGWKYLLTLVGYVIATLWYSRSLKRIPMVDVLTLAALYALRVIAGAAATEIIPSFWLLAFTMFLFLSLAVAKRYSELKLMMKSGRTETAGRGYTTDDVALLQSSGLSSGYIAVLVLALYVNSDVAQKMYSHPRLMWLLCPLLLYWVTRVWFKTSRGQMDDDPVIFALRDRPSLYVAAVAALLIFAAA